jgi:hypothetical protein
MTGPQHYREGERLTALALGPEPGKGKTHPNAYVLLEGAKAHFAAAQAAATAVGADRYRDRTYRSTRALDDWAEVLEA